MVHVGRVSTSAVQEIAGLRAEVSCACCSYRDGVETRPARTCIPLQTKSQLMPGKSQSHEQGLGNMGDQGVEMPTGVQTQSFCDSPTCLVTSSFSSRALLGPECLLPCETKPLDAKYHSDVFKISGFSSNAPACDKNPEEAKGTECKYSCDNIAFIRD